MEEIDYKKKNLCPICKGTKNIPIPHSDNFVKCCETGTYIEYLENHIKSEKYSYNRLVDNYKILQNWVKHTSKCSLCGGDQTKTWGLLRCEECGIPGTGYWPG